MISFLFVCQCERLEQFHMDSVVLLIAVPPKQQSSFTTSLLGISIVVNLLLCFVFFGIKWES